MRKKFKFIIVSIFIFLIIFLAFTLADTSTLNNEGIYDKAKKQITIQDKKTNQTRAIYELSYNDYICGAKGFTSNVTCRAIFDIEKFEDDSPLIDSMKVKGEWNFIWYDTNLKESWFEIQNGTRKEKINTYEEICIKGEDANQTSSCNYQISGFYLVDVPTYAPYDIKTLEPSGNYTLVFYGIKESGDTVDWKPTFLGVDAGEHWANWTSASTVFEYRFEENLKDSSIHDYLFSNSTPLGIPFGGSNPYVSSIVGYGVALDTGPSASPARFNISGDTLGQKVGNFSNNVNWTFSVWIKPWLVWEWPTIADTYIVYDGHQGSEHGLKLKYGGSAKVNGAYGLVCLSKHPSTAVVVALNLSNDIWTHVACTYNMTSMSMWVNGSMYNTTSIADADDYLVQNIINPFAVGLVSDVQVDEMKFWNISLSAEDIISIYDSEKHGNLLMRNSSSTIISPVDWFNSSLEAEFICGAYSSESVNNQSVYINSTGWHRNETNSTIDTGNSVNSTLNISNLQDGYDYLFNCESVDNSSSFDFDSSNRTITIDTPPLINISTIQTNTLTPNITFNASDGHGIAECWLNVTRGVAVEINPISINLNVLTQNISLSSDTTYIAHFNCTDLRNNQTNHTTQSFTIDTIFPLINITFPTNNTNYSTQNLNINYSIFDTNLDDCWYSNDTWTENTTIVCGNNITDIFWTEGGHEVIIWANDSSNNINSSSINFTIDTISPLINMTNPQNTTYTANANIELRYTVSDSHLDSCWYSNNSGITNHSIACGTNVTLNAMQGNNTWLVGANDTLGNQNMSNITFTIDGLVETEGTWVHYYPRLNQQTRWFNSLSIKSYLNYDYNYSIDMTADTLANSTSTIVEDQYDTSVSHTFDSTSGNISFSDFVYGYLTGTSNTTYFNLYYNNSKINLTETNFSITIGSRVYETYNLSIVANSTRNISNVYMYFNFSDTQIVRNALYNCTAVAGDCSTDISSDLDTTWSDNDGDGNYDFVEFFIDTISNDSHYQLRNLIGSPIQISKDVDILNPPVRAFDNLEWRNTITLYNPNPYDSEKVFKLELPFGSRNVVMDDVSKNLQYDPSGTLSPYILVLDKNDPTHTESIYLHAGETKTIIIEYITDSVTITSSTFFPDFYTVGKKAKIVQVLRIKNQAEDNVTDFEHRIPISYAEDLVVCDGNNKYGCPDKEREKEDYDELLIDEIGKVKGDYKLEIDSILSGEVKEVTLSYFVPTADVEKIEKGRRVVKSDLLAYDAITFISQAPFSLDDVRYKTTIPESNIQKVVECMPNGLCDTNLIVENNKVRLGFLDVGARKIIHIWYVEGPPPDEVKGFIARTLAKILGFGREFKLTGIWKILFGWAGFENEKGETIITTGRIILIGSGFLILIIFLTYIIIKRNLRIKINLNTQKT